MEIEIFQTEEHNKNVKGVHYNCLDSEFYHTISKLT